LVAGNATGSQFSIGTTTVKYVYTDAAGNVSDTCSFDVIIVDNDPPTALCQDITVQLDGAGSASLIPADIDNGSSDGCGLDSLRIDISSFDCTNIGANIVTLTAVDLYGNEASCPATVTVEDTVEPVVICQNFDAYLDINGQVTVSTSDIDNGSTDNCNICQIAVT